jgi:hypothetical protein
MLPSAGVATLASGISLDDVLGYMDPESPQLKWGNFWDDHTSPDSEPPEGVVDVAKAINDQNIDGNPLAERFDLEAVSYEDLDADGIEDYVEGLVDNAGDGGRGDGNGDGQLDVDQPDVASLPTKGARRGFATLQASEGELVSVTARWAPVEYQENMPYGAFAFEVHGVPEGGAVQLDLYLPLDEEIDQLWKEIGGNWKEIEPDEILHRDGEKTRFRFTVRDGGPLDGDGQQNSMITDDFAPAFGIAEVMIPLAAILNSAIVCLGNPRRTQASRPQTGDSLLRLRSPLSTCEDPLRDDRNAARFFVSARLKASMAVEGPSIPPTRGQAWAESRESDLTWAKS